MPFGLKNAPATFQRMMDNAFRGLIGTKCFAYIDDIVVFESTIQEHNDNLTAVIERIHQLGLRLEPKKCEYLKQELEYLGHIITKEGAKPNPEKINCINNFRPLKNVKDIQSIILKTIHISHRCIKPRIRSSAKPRRTHLLIHFENSEQSRRKVYHLRRRTFSHSMGHEKTDNIC